MLIGHLEIFFLSRRKKIVHDAFFLRFVRYLIDKGFPATIYVEAIKGAA